MALYLGSEASIEEKLKLNIQLSSSDIDALLTRINELESEIEDQHKTEELLDEQLDFAKDLLENIEQGLNDSKSAKQAMNAFKFACAESLFER